jgi:hypothetical protein
MINALCGVLNVLAAVCSRNPPALVPQRAAGPDVTFVFSCEVDGKHVEDVVFQRRRAGAAAAAARGRGRAAVAVPGAPPPLAGLPGAGRVRGSSLGKRPAPTVPPQAQELGADGPHRQQLSAGQAASRALEPTAHDPPRSLHRSLATCRVPVPRPPLRAWQPPAAASGALRSGSNSSAGGRKAGPATGTRLVASGEECGAPSQPPQLHPGAALPSCCGVVLSTGVTGRTCPPQLQLSPLHELAARVGQGSVDNSTHCDPMAVIEILSDGDT